MAMQRTETILHIDVIGDTIPREIRGNMMRNLSLETMDIWFGTGELNPWSNSDYDDSRVLSSTSSGLGTSETFQSDDSDLETRQELINGRSVERVSNEIDHSCEESPPLSAVDTITQQGGKLDFVDDSSLEALENRFAKLNSSTPYEEIQGQISIRQNEREFNLIQGKVEPTLRDIYRLRKRSGKRRCSSWTNEKPRPFYKPIVELTLQETLLNNSPDAIIQEDTSWQQRLLDEILLYPILPKTDYHLMEDQAMMGDSFPSKSLFNTLKSLVAARSFSTRENRKSVSIMTNQRGSLGQRPRSSSVDSHFVQCTFAEGIPEKEEDPMLTMPQADTLTQMVRFALSTELNALY
jgi:hypothetical protein